MANGAPHGMPPRGVLPPGLGGVMLDGHSGQVTVREQRIIIPGLVEPRKGGLTDENSNWHLFTMDIGSGVAWLFPFTAQAGRSIAGNILKAAGAMADDSESRAE